MTNKQLTTYIGLLFIFSWTIQISAIIVNGSINTDTSRLWLVATMLSPLLVTAAYLIKNKSLRHKLLWKPNWSIFRIGFMAVLIPTVVAFTVVIIIQQLGYGHSEWFSFSQSSIKISGGPFLLGKGDQSWFLFIANVLVTGVVYSVVNAVIASGEEFAWRGFLQGILIEKYGTIKGITILGFIWSMWHLPVLLDGYNFPENPILGSFIIFPMQLIGASFFMGWLTLKSRSFIPAAIAHGAGNSIQEGIISNINMTLPRIYEDLITMTVTFLVGLFFLFLLWNKSPKDKLFPI